MFFHIITQNRDKYYHLSEEEVKKIIKLGHLNFNNCKIYSSEKKLDEIASIFEQRRIEQEGDTIHGLYIMEHAIELDGSFEFIKDCTYNFFK